MTIHLSGPLLDWILDHYSAASIREQGLWWGAPVVVDEDLAPNEGCWQAADGRVRYFVLDGFGLHSTREGVRAAT
jgi:hypothetical protein